MLLSFLLLANAAHGSALPEQFFRRGETFVSLGTSYTGNVCAGGIPIEQGKAKLYCRIGLPKEKTDPSLAGIFACQSGKLEGMATLTPCGGDLAEIPYHQGKKHGIAKTFYPGGELKSEESYRAGKKHGYQTKYLSDGTVTEKIFFADGLLQGRSIQFDLDKNLAKVKFFKKGADQGRSDYFTVNLQEQLILAASGDNELEVKKLLEKGAKPGISGETEFTPETPLHAAAEFGRNKLVSLFLEKGANPNVFDKSKNTTPLLRALAHPETVELLLNRGADPNLAGKTGNTPLHEAARFGYLETVALLLEFKANPMLLNQEGDTPQKLARTGANENKLVSLLRGIKASKSVSQELQFQKCRELSKKLAGYVSANPEKMAEISLCPKGSLDQAHLNQALGNAAALGKLPTALYLLRNGVMVNAVSGVRQESPLLASARAGRLDAVELFLDQGATVDLPDADGHTPLMGAVESGNLPIVRLLLKQGAKRDLKNKEGLTAVDIARKKKLQGITELLVDYR